MALSSKIKQLQWLSQLLKNTGFPDYIKFSLWMIKIYADNTESMALVKNPYLYKCLKHIYVAYHYTQDLQRRGCLQVMFISNKKMIIDGLIKPLPTSDFKEFVKGMRMFR